MAASIRSLFVTGEAILPNLKVKQPLLRLVVSEDCALAKDELDFVQDADCDASDLCFCAKKWLAGTNAEEGGSCSLERRCWRIRMSPVVFSCLVYELNKSRNFRTNVLDKIRARMADADRASLARCVASCPSCDPHLHLNVRIVVTWKGPFQMDRIWNRHLETLIHERIELDEMLACLSTLGGAFSSMGDLQLTCAETAGRISLHQMRIATKLGDVTLVAKCKLFLALSLMQRGDVRGAKRIIRAQHALAKSLPEAQKDARLEKMCKGAWAKLQYIHGQRRTPTE